VSGQLYLPTALVPGKAPLVSSQWEDGRNTQPVWAFWRTDKTDVVSVNVIIRRVRVTTVAVKIKAISVTYSECVVVASHT